MKKIELKTYINETNSLKNLSKEDASLVIKSQEITKNAYAPYSKFKVGAAILLSNNEIITGSNQENSAYPSGLCAERVALFYANSKFPNVPIKTIAISAFYKNKFVENPIPPCGACRQVILETEIRFKNKIKLILFGTEKIFLIDSIKQILPLYFNETFL